MEILNKIKKGLIEILEIAIRTMIIVIGLFIIICTMWSLCGFLLGIGIIMAGFCFKNERFKNTFN
jgi:hypothetical protein